MYRFVSISLTALVLAACEPASPPAAPPAAPEPAATPEPTTTAVADWAVLEDQYRQMEAPPADPLGALEWRAVVCRYLGSEIGGDNSQRDQDLMTRMDESSCGTLEADAAALRTANASDPAMVARIDAMLAYYEG